MHDRFGNKVAAVTGAGQGVGKRCARPTEAGWYKHTYGLSLSSSLMKRNGTLDEQADPTTERLGSR